MKKIISMILSMALLCTMCIGCGKEAGGDNTGSSASKYATAAEAFNAVTGNWNQDFLFPWIGGDSFETPSETPASIDLTKNYAESVLSYWFYLSEDQAANVKDAASLIHAMNLNTFSAICVKLADGTDTAAFAKNYGEALNNVMWMCGFPESRLVMEADGYLFLSFGATDIINELESAVNKTFDDAKVLFTETATLDF